MFTKKYILLMKIRRYNDFIFESSMEKRYELVDTNYIDNKIKNLSMEKFTQKEFHIIRNLLYDFVLDWSNVNNNKKTIDILIINELRQKIIQRIYKYSDEWYVISNFTTFNYYICDGFDGLIECLKEKTLKVNESLENIDKGYINTNARKIMEKIKNLEMENFKDMEYESIEKLVPKGKYTLILTSFFIPYNNTLCNKLVLKENRVIISYIYKYSDEWYMVFPFNSLSDYCICDGLKGLSNYIREKTTDNK